MELFCTFPGWGTGQLCLGQTTHILLPEFKELRAPCGCTVLIQGLQHHQRVTIFGGDGVNLVINAVEEVSSARVWDLVTNMNELVFVLRTGSRRDPVSNENL